MKLVSPNRLNLATVLVLLLSMVLLIQTGELWKKGERDFILVGLVLLVVIHKTSQWRSKPTGQEDSIFRTSEVAGADGRKISEELIRELMVRADYRDEMDWEWAIVKQRQTGISGMLLVDRIRLLRALRR
jgi:hypothetical protein